jgi:methyltransferase (TIGR00027 family)
LARRRLSLNMLEREPSRTAFGAAAYRAIHQLLEGSFFFNDPFAVPILGIDPEALKADPAAGDDRRGIRFFVVARSVIAETALKRGVEERGVGQLVVLGAGLDTFAYRNPFEGRLKVFEVDHPATQAWKRRRLEEAGIPIPDSLTYAPVDFEREDLTERLAAAGLQPGVRTFFTWLGVVPYLTGEAIASTLRQVGGHPGGSEVVFDYSEPREAIDPELQAHYAERAARVAAIGEPFLSFFTPAELHEQLRGVGFAEIDDLDVPGVIARLTGKTPEGPARRTGGHVLFAATKAL